MKRIVQVATIPFVLVLGTPVGYACFCINPEVKEAFDRAKIVFVGEVLEVMPPRSTDANAEFVDAAHTFKFKVETAWKEQFWTEASVLARMDNCFSLRTLPQKGEKYLVYAEPVYRDDPSRREVMTHSCTRTALLPHISPASGVYYRNQAANDIRALNSIMMIFGTRPKPTTIPIMNFLTPDN